MNKIALIALSVSALAIVSCQEPGDAIDGHARILNSLPVSANRPAPAPLPVVKKPELTPPPAPVAKAPEIKVPEVNKPEPRPVVAQKQPEVAPRPAPVAKAPEIMIPEVRKPEPRPVVLPKPETPRQATILPTAAPAVAPRTAPDSRDIVMPGQRFGGRRR